jgi:tetratricopeptide (TPR) repeat protein
MKALRKDQNWAAGCRLSALLVLGTFFCAVSTQAQGQRYPDRFHPPTPMGPITNSESSPRAGGGASITVCVVDEVGFPLDKQATVKLRDQTSQRVAWGSTNGRAEAEFANLTAGEYEIEASAPGFEVVRQEFRAESNHEAYRVLIALPRDIPGAVSEVRPGQILAPKARKEVEKGIAVMKQGKLTDAEKHFEAAYKLAPTNADVNYLLGVVCARQKNLTDAERYLRRAISLDPRYANAETKLGQVRREKGAVAGATQTGATSVSAQ